MSKVDCPIDCTFVVKIFGEIIYTISTRQMDILEICKVNGPNLFLSLLYTGLGESCVQQAHP